MSRVDGHQLSLPREAAHLDMVSVRRQQTMTAAIHLCVGLGGFENDKDFCRQFGIDPGLWTRIKNGEAHFPHDRLAELFGTCGNEVPLFWLADKRGYELQRKVSEAERMLNEEREKRAETERENAILRKLLIGRAA